MRGRALATDGATPWQRLDGEGSKAFAAFQSYRDQAPMARSLRRLAGLLGRSMQLIAGWSSKYRWVARVAAWDAEQDRLLQVQVAAERAAFAKRLAAAGALMQAKGYGRIRAYVDRIDKDGYEVQLRPGQRFTDEMTLTEAIRLVEAGARLEVMGRGSPSERPAEPGNATVVENSIIQALTIDPAKTVEAVGIMKELATLLGLGYQLEG